MIGLNRPEICLVKITTMEEVAAEATPKKRRLLGRAARRRRRKQKEIERIEQALLHAGAGAEQGISNSTTAAVPLVEEEVDSRSHIWPSVLQRRQEFNWNNKEDGAALQGQLGYLPGNVIRIAARCRDVSFLPTSSDAAASAAVVINPQDPLVAHLYPIAVRAENTGKKGGFKARKRTRGEKNGISSGNNITNQNNDSSGEKSDGGGDEKQSNSNEPQQQQQQQLIEPFPTAYWVTHPLLRCWISKLELEGFGSTLEERLRQDDAALKAMKETHAAYGRERWSLLTNDDQRMLQQRGWTAAFQTGVAGNSRNFGSVKCLHAHTAHRLAGHQNTVGTWVLEELEKRAWGKPDGGTGIQPCQC